MAYQPNRRGKSWELTIKGQRSRFLRVLKENPGLKSKLDSCLLNAYQDAVVEAAKETAFDESVFPENCPWSWEEMTNNLFYPD